MKLAVCWTMAGIVLNLCLARDVRDVDEEFIPYTGKRRNNFDWAICSELDKIEPGNVVSSPLSVKLLLTLIYEGSFGHPRNDLRRILELDESTEVRRKKASALLASLTLPNEYNDMKLALAMFTDVKVKPRKSFRDVLFKYYQVDIQRIDFRDIEAAANIINTWASVFSNGRIQNIIEPDQSLESSSVILANTVYFSGQWRETFDVQKSYTGNFAGINGPRPVRFMTQSGIFHIAESKALDIQMLRLPYKGNKIAMYILLPNKPNGLQWLIKTLNPFHLRNIVSNLEEMPVQITIPSFKFEYKIDYNEILEKIGLGSLFNQSGAFFGFVHNQNISLSKVVQKAAIEVTETGTVAAASSAAQFVYKLGLSEVEFTADHPFLFYIEDETTQTITFSGKFADPDVVSAELQPHENNPPSVQEKPLPHQYNPPSVQEKPLPDENKPPYVQGTPLPHDNKPPTALEKPLPHEYNPPSAQETPPPPENKPPPAPEQPTKPLPLKYGPTAIPTQQQTVSTKYPHSSTSSTEDGIDNDNDPESGFSNVSPHTVYKKVLQTNSEKPLSTVYQSGRPETRSSDEEREQGAKSSTEYPENYLKNRQIESPVGFSTRVSQLSYFNNDFPAWSSLFYGPRRTPLQEWSRTSWITINPDSKLPKSGRPYAMSKTP